MFKYLKSERFFCPLLKEISKYNNDRNIFYNTLQFFGSYFCSLCKKNKIISMEKNLFQENAFKCNKCENDAVNILDTDMFQTFGIEYSFNIDKKLLESRFKEMIKLSHPDVNENTSMDIPIHIIKNYKQLNDPFERALLIISKKLNTNRKCLIDKIDLLPANDAIIDEMFETDMKIKEIEAGNMEKYDLSNMIEENNKVINKYIGLLEIEFGKESWEVTNILKILKDLRMYQKLDIKLSEI